MTGKTNTDRKKGKENNRSEKLDRNTEDETRGGTKERATLSI